MKRSETTTSYRSVLEASQRRPSPTTSCTSGRRRSAAFHAPKWAPAAAATSGTISTTVVRSTPSAGPALAVMPVAMPTNATRCGAERAEPGAHRRDQVGEDDVRDRGEKKPRPETDRREHDEAGRDRARDGAERVGGRELAERPGCPLPIAECRPEGGQHGAGGEGTRPSGHRRETDDTE